MSIQQSINQMLALAAGGAGLYAHSPAGQKAAEIKNLERERDVLEKIIDRGENTQTELGRSADIAERLFQLDPTDKRSETAIEARGKWESHPAAKKAIEKEKNEKNALTSLLNRVDTIESRVSGFEKRKAILKKSRKKGGR